MSCLKIIFFSFICFVSSWEIIDDLIVEIDDGKILGRFTSSITGKPVKAFMGIPYAQAPVGDLRFKSPQKIQPWSGVKRTQFDGPRCIQPDFQQPGQEDCLYLNVYVPDVNNTKLPVLVWIHGGAFIYGDGSSTAQSPQYIMEHEVILVSGNYRLGPLGFLSTEDKNAPGNFGFKDQSFILKWIQENIEHFGGDKNSVTIWGESAGAVSVNYQMLSPLSRGLFDRAISNSGTIHNAWADPWRKGEALENTKKLAEALNCSTSDSASIIDCLKSVSASDIISKAALTEFGNRVVIEDFEINEPPFIVDRKIPKESAEIPWLLGINSDEGLMFTGRYINSELEKNNLINSWNERIPKSFDYNHLSPSLQSSITKEISQFYFGSETLKSDFAMQNLTNLFTDVSFLGIIEVLKQRFEFGNSENTFVYLFTHKGSASMESNLDFNGSSHADDLIYFFAWHKIRFISSIPTSEDEELFKHMPILWVNFAKNGYPNSSNALSIPSWSSASSIPFNYMQIGNENGNSMNLFQTKNGLYEKRAEFWMKLREDYQLSRWNNSNKFHTSILMIFCLFLFHIIMK